MKNKIWIFSILMMVLFVTGCGKDENTLNVAYFDNITHGQALVMKSQNMLQTELGNDMKVKWFSFDAGTSLVEALFSKDIDIGYIGPVPAVSANIKSKGDFVIISGAAKGGTVLIAKKGSNIQSVKDLKGKSVSVPSIGNTQHLLLLKLLKENQLSVKSDKGDVNIVEANNADVANLMKNGDIDAAIVPEPWGSTLTGKQVAETVLNYKEIADNGDYVVTTVIVNKDYMDSHEEVVKKFLKAHIKATEYIVQYPDEAAKVMNQQLKEDTGKKIEENIISDSLKSISFSADFGEKSVFEYARICKDINFIKQMPDSGIISDKLINSVMNSRK